MKTTKHSPGPWKVKIGDADRRDMSMITKASDDKFTIAHVICEYQQKQQREEDIANAHLMAASPELFEIATWSLEAFETACDFLANGTPIRNGSELNVDMIACRDKLRSIIAKANPKTSTASK